MKRPKTEPQIEAARANGALSSGPVTPEGKVISALNATRHGLLANTILIAGESREDFDHLLNSKITEFLPQTETELCLIEEMAVCKWRQIRIWGMAAQGHNYEIGIQAEKSPELLNANMPTRAFIAMKEMNRENNTTDQLNRYETRFSRHYLRLYKELTSLRRAREEASKNI